LHAPVRVVPVRDGAAVRVAGEVLLEVVLEPRVLLVPPRGVGVGPTRGPVAAAAEGVGGVQADEVPARTSARGAVPRVVAVVVTDDVAVAVGPGGHAPVVDVPRLGRAARLAGNWRRVVLVHARRRVRDRVEVAPVAAALRAGTR